MIRTYVCAMFIVLGFLIVIAEVERMDNEVATEWSGE